MYCFLQGFHLKNPKNAQKDICFEAWNIIISEEGKFTLQVVGENETWETVNIDFNICFLLIQQYFSRWSNFLDLRLSKRQTRGGMDIPIFRYWFRATSLKMVSRFRTPLANKSGLSERKNWKIGLTIADYMMTWFNSISRKSISVTSRFKVKGVLHARNILYTTSLYFNTFSMIKHTREKCLLIFYTFIWILMIGYNFILISKHKPDLEYLHLKHLIYKPIFRIEEKDLILNKNTQSNKFTKGYLFRTYNNTFFQECFWIINKKFRILSPDFEDSFWIIHVKNVPVQTKKKIK